MGIVITLLVIGAILLILETVLPGMIAGILGFGCLVAAVVVGYTEFGTKGGNFLLLVVSVGLVTGTLLWMKYFPDSAIARVFVSKKVIGTIGADQPELLHQTGVAHTPLRPSGTAVIGDKRVDVVSEGNLIDKGKPVKVVAIEGMRTVVREISIEEMTDQDQEHGQGQST